MLHGGPGPACCASLLLLAALSGCRRSATDPGALRPVEPGLPAPPESAAATAGPQLGEAGAQAGADLDSEAGRRKGVELRPGGEAPAPAGPPITAARFNYNLTRQAILNHEMSLEVVLHMDRAAFYGWAWAERDRASQEYQKGGEGILIQDYVRVAIIHTDSFEVNPLQDENTPQAIAGQPFLRWFYFVTPKRIGTCEFSIGVKTSPVPDRFPGNWVTVKNCPVQVAAEAGPSPGGAWERVPEAMRHVSQAAEATRHAVEQTSALVRALRGLAAAIVSFLATFGLYRWGRRRVGTGGLVPAPAGRAGGPPRRPRKKAPPAGTGG